MNKKLLSIMVVVILVVGLGALYSQFLAPEAQEGEKEVTLEIVIEKEGIEETFVYQTDGEYLMELLEEHSDELELETEETSFGDMLVGFFGYRADDGANEFFKIVVDGEDAMVGAAELPLEDGSVYTIELDTF